MKILQKDSFPFHRIEKRIKAFLVLTLCFIKIAPFFELENSHFSQMAGYYDLLKMCADHSLYN